MRALCRTRGLEADYTLAGDPGALDPDDLRDQVAGFVEAPPSFLPLLQTAVWA